MSIGTTQRVCFQLQVDPARLDEYRERHAAVWPDMLRAIESSGRRNYSLFLRDDGLLVGYYEVDDDDAAQASLANDPRTAPWEAEMAEFFVALDGARPDQGAPRLHEVFHLEDQLAALDGGSAASATTGRRTGPETTAPGAGAGPAASVTTRTESSEQ
ncbi:L-rhamnose mutarotase [Agromyces bracchium]|uniref:L-rhamnose mutarotase n=1 Tax=Agromyces bracchium TaxID=88376 RepID=A0A6I3M9V7_9MICO|nr:L-rhamnose mutarotase [Agromyces bracchium]MTH70084.1 L-rhamnose mutarotase [Agromyces bracchium]